MKSVDMEKNVEDQLDKQGIGIGRGVCYNDNSKKMEMDWTYFEAC